MNTLVQQYFKRSVERFPNKTAVSCNEDNISFKELDLFTNGLAHEIKKSGINRSEFVPFFMKKSINSIKSILGILKSDCVYVPLDANSPAQRLISIIETISAKLILVDDESLPILKSLLPEFSQCKLLNVSSFDSLSNAAPIAQNISIDLAYVLFTSGSTGIPKGVMIPHKAIIDYIDWCVDEYQLTENDIISNHAPLYFDNSTFDLYTAFKTGATLHLVHDDLNAVIPLLVGWLKSRKITTFFCVPSVLTMLLRSRRLKPDSLPDLRYVICAGEVLPTDAVAAWMEKYPHITFVNMYGPTEITVDCSFYRIEKTPSNLAEPIPIGIARNNMEMFVRNSDNTISNNIGDRGELLVRGTSVAYGYLSDLEKTNKAFIQNPMHSLYHDPLYCTGDVVEINDKKQYIFVGRADDQIKYLGYRIELGEIESILMSISYVNEAVVVFNKSEDGSTDELGALIDMNESVESLNINLKDLLPAYMVPSRLKIQSTDFPRTPNGKYDRKQVLKSVFE
ncbi:Polyketide synthase modules and related proteins [hydrothermal vent metagenome]|uniref:Polyketide synthase modules and related proteins n=1 Tax=hydrothermal vent metagenome TaxID=652676 RepID=A0A3B0XI06_9ZZZZ